MRVCIAGGDGRLGYLADLLRQTGHEVSLWGRGEGNDPLALTRAQAVVLPFPRAAEGGLLPSPGCGRPIPVEEVISLMGEGIHVMAGALGEDFLRAAREKNWHVVLPGEDPAYEQENAMPSAEGAIFAAMQKAPHTICGSTCLVIGPGRIGKELAWMLLGLGARVLLAARSEIGLQTAEAMGCVPVPMEALPIFAREANILFNTAPAPVAGEAVMVAMPARALAIDLASPPYGIDLEAARRHGIIAWREGGIPGKYAPQTAAKCLLHHFQAHIGEGFT